MKLFNSNETKYRLWRTIIQGVLGTIAASLDVIIGGFTIPVVWKPIIVSLVMSILSPIMSELGKMDGNNSGVGLVDSEGGRIN